MRRIPIALAVAALFPALAAAKNMYVPVASYSPGANNTHWRTDLRVYNPSSVHTLPLSLHFLPQGMDGRNISGRVYTVPPRGTLVLDNVVQALWPEIQQAVGAVRIDSDTEESYPFVASTRTYTNSPDASRPGTYGQFVPALDPAEARTKTALLHVAVTPQYRTNAGAMNPFDDEVALTMKLVGTDGVVVLESLVKTVPPKSMIQWSMLELFGGFFAADATIVVESTGPVFTWASVIDNASGDAVFVRGVEHDETVRPLP